MRPISNRPTAQSPLCNALPCGAPDPAALGVLEDQSLLRLLLDRCLVGSNVDRVADALLDRFGGLGEIVAAETAELGRVADLGPRAILDLKLLRELSVRLSRSAANRRPVLSSWNALLVYARTTLAHLPREQFRTLYLDRRNILLRDEFVADGTIDHAPVYVATVVDCYLALTAGRAVLSSRQCVLEGAGR